MNTEILSTYIIKIVGILLMICFTYLGVAAKKLYQKYVNTNEKETVARIVVQAVEQMYKSLHGDDKLNKALEMMSSLLAEKNITISAEEMRILIEAAVGEFNNNFLIGNLTDENKIGADTEETLAECDDCKID